MASTSDYQDNSGTIHLGDALTVLKALPAQMARMCVTSPPYWGLRDYKMPGQIGLEDSPEAYLHSMCLIFDEVHRILAEDGTLWVNMGDSYAGNPGNGRGGGLAGNGNIPHHSGMDTSRAGFKTKDLCGMPWMLAFALRSRGWYLRSDIIWHKPNPMPESVVDRPTKAHEYLFLLSKRPKYYYDSKAIMEPVSESFANDSRHKTGSTENPNRAEYLAAGAQDPKGPHKIFGKGRKSRDNFKRINSKRSEVMPGQSVGTHREDRKDSEYDLGRRNRRTVWTVATKPFEEAHFATFPPKLIEPCILAGSAAGDTVLDPFMGAGTTALVAKNLGRRFVGAELNPEYLAICAKRLRQEVLI